MVVGATNRPQELDDAARRRLVKRLYIPLPESGARRQIIERLLAQERHSLNKEQMNEIVEATAGYSGADMASLCKEAAMGYIRTLNPDMLKNLHKDDVRPISAEDFVPALRQVNHQNSSEKPSHSSKNAHNN